MTIINSLKRQFRSVIQWDMVDNDTLFYEWSENGDEIKNATKLIVGPSQGCIFVYEGKIQAVFNKEGMINISTSNIPFITTIKKFMQFFESEHKTAFYFYKKSILTNQKWGTLSPIKYIDPIYQFLVELIAFGNYSTQIKNPEMFFTSIVGQRPEFRESDLKNIVNSRLVHTMSDYFASSKLSYNHIDEYRDEVGDELGAKLNTIFEELGFSLTDFRIEGTEFDENTKNRINKIADTQATNYAAKSAGISYTQMRQLDALQDAANNQVGAAGMMMGANSGGALSANITNQATFDNSLSARLSKLQELFNANLITKEEYTAKKQKILDEI